jgi:hypothetical protein
MLKMTTRKSILIILIVSLSMLMVTCDNDSADNDSASANNIKIQKLQLDKNVIDQNSMVNIIKSIFGSQKKAGERNKRTSDLGSSIFAGK